MQGKELHTSDEDAISEFAGSRLAWYRMLQVSRTVRRELDRRLTDGHRISVSEFDVLITLDNAAGRRLRMSELADAVMFSSGGLTRLIGRLEGRGLVERRPHESDARGLHAVLTDDGARRLAEARVTHDRVIEELVSANLTDGELDRLVRTLGALM